MRILLDECVPRRLRQLLAGHDVQTVPGMGWSGMTNGALLALMAAENLPILITVDQNIQYQQHLAAAGVAVIVLVAKSNRYAELAPLMPAVVSALATAQPGDCIEISEDTLTPDD